MCTLYIEGFIIRMVGHFAGRINGESFFAGLNIGLIIAPVRKRLEFRY